MAENEGVIAQKNGTEQSFNRYLTARGEARAQVKQYEEKAANVALKLAALKPWNFKRKSEIQQQLSRYQNNAEEAKKEWKADDKEKAYNALLKRLPKETAQAKSAQVKLAAANFELRAINQKLAITHKTILEKLREKNAMRRQQEQVLKALTVSIPVGFRESVEQVKAQDKAAVYKPPQIKPRGMGR